MATGSLVVARAIPVGTIVVNMCWPLEVLNIFVCAQDTGRIKFTISCFTYIYFQRILNRSLRIYF